MKTKIFYLVTILLVSNLCAVQAADDLKAPLQQGLLEEEGNHNLDAAIQAYQAAVTQFDKDRQLAATAIFRLGECYRKLGKTNEAVIQYQRVLRDFADQTELARLSQNFVQQFAGAAGSTGVRLQPIAGRVTAAEADYAMYRRQLDELKKLPRDRQAIVIQQNFPNPVLTSLMQDLNQAEQKLAALRVNFADTHPDVAAAEKVRDTIQKQIVVQVDGTITALESKMAAALTAAPQLAARVEQKRLLEEEIQLVEKDLAGKKKQFANGVVSQAEVNAVEREILKLRRQLAALDAGPVETPSAETAATDEEQKEVQRIKALIQDSPDLINSPDQTGRTPLHKAAAAGQLTVARFLLANKADVNARLAKDGSATPLVLAARNGHKTMVELLLANGADVNLSGEIHEGKRKSGTALHFAAANNYKTVAEVLLANKANVNAKSENRSTPLHEAAAAGSRPMVELLLANGAEVNALDLEGTPLYHAASQGRDAVVELLIIRKADVNAPPANGTPPVAEAVQKGRLRIVEELLGSGADANAKKGGYSLLHLALNSPEMLKLILAHKPDLEIQDPEGLTPLQRAVYDRPSLESVQMLLSAGAKADAPIDRSIRLNYPGLQPGSSYPISIQGCSSLIVAVLMERVDIVTALLEHGANPNVKFGDRSALHYAIVERRSLPLVNALLASRPNTELRDNEGCTPLLRAILMNEPKICEALIKAGANVNATAPRVSDRSALHIAVGNKFKDIVELLLTNKAEVNVIDKEGYTPLSFAKMRNPQANAEWQKAQEELTDLLLKHGANEFLQRLNYIGVERGGRQIVPQLFSKGTNAYNRYSLFEAIASLYQSPSPNSIQPPFPDFTRVRVNRIESKENKTKDINVDVDTILRSGECSHDVWLEWGDVVDIPEQDHPINEGWAGLPGEISEGLRKCLERQVTIVVKEESTTIKLVPTLPTSSISIGPTVRQGVVAGVGGLGKLAQPGKRTSLAASRLRETIYAAGLLRASSDVTRVTVKRTDPITKEKLELPFNLDKVDPQTDLWLRDGDVIEVPDK